MDKKILLAFCEFNLDANRMVMEKLSELKEEDLLFEFSRSHSSVQALVFHYLVGEAYFLAQCMGEPFEIFDMPSLAEMRSWWEGQVPKVWTYVQAADSGELEKVVEIQFGDHKPLRYAVWQLLMQAWMHSHHHRGELSLLLPELGHELPMIDMMAWFTSKSDQEWPF